MARRATQFTFSVELLDTAYSAPTFKSGLSPTATISKDGGSFSATTNTPAEIASSGAYALTLTAAEMDADWVHVRVASSGAYTASERFWTDQEPSGTVVVGGGGNTSSSFATSRAEATANFWKDALVLFTSGALAGQCKKVTTYTVTNGVFAVTNLDGSAGGFTGTPSNGDRFVLVNK